MGTPTLQIANREKDKKKDTVIWMTYEQTAHQAIQVLEQHQQGRKARTGHQAIVNFFGGLGNAQMETLAFSVTMLPGNVREEEEEDVPVPERMTGENHLGDTPPQGIIAGRPAPQVQVDSADHLEVKGQPHQQEEEDHQLGGTLALFSIPKRERERQKKVSSYKREITLRKIR